MPSRPLSTDRGRGGARRETAEVGAPQIVNLQTRLFARRHRPIGGDTSQRDAKRPPLPDRGRRRFAVQLFSELLIHPRHHSPPAVARTLAARHSPNECCIFTEGSNPRVAARTTRPRAPLALDRSIDTFRLRLRSVRLGSSTLFFVAARPPRARVSSPTPRGDRPRIRRASRVARVRESISTYDTVSSRSAGRSDV